MKKRSVFTGIVVALLTTIFAVQVCFAWPSAEFREEDGEIFDDWNICRTDAFGDEGFLQIKKTRTRMTFRPVIALESLGEYSDIAYKLGEQFAEKYPDRTQRAQKIFEYVRDGLRYTHDIDVFGMGEYALNADEILDILQEKGEARADCEEHALLLVVMYLGAGYRAGITLSPGHLAVVLYMPEYERANEVFTLSGDRGWIWLEATGNTNPFGWFPKGQVETPILGYEVTADEHLPLFQPRPPVLALIGDKEVNEDEMLRFTLSATDDNDDDLTYSAKNLPVGAKFNANGRTFSWTPEAPGIYPGIRFEVSDGTLTDSEDITITVRKVNRPPVLAAIGDKEVNEDEMLRFTLSATDANDDHLTYSAGNLPMGAEFNANSRTFSWTPDTPGAHRGVYFEVSDGVLTDSEDITITVRKVNKPPVLAAIGDKEVNEDEMLRFTLSATDANDDDLTYSAGNLPMGAEFNANSRTFSWTPDADGIYPGVRFEVSDGALTDSEDITIIVLEKGNPALVIAGIIAGVLVVAVVATVILRRARRA